MMLINMKELKLLILPTGLWNDQKTDGIPLAGSDFNRVHFIFKVAVI